MTDPATDDSDQIFARVEMGDVSAINALLRQYRNRLRQMITIRIDTRLRARVDPSDVVQETMAIAYSKLPDYVSSRTISFYPWLRQIAMNQLVDLQRKHIVAERRTVIREQNRALLSDESVADLFQILATKESGPQQTMAKQELQHSIRTAIEQLSATDRDVLIMRMLEQMSIKEVAESLGINTGAVKTRQYRALKRIRQFLNADNA